GELEGGGDPGANASLLGEFGLEQSGTQLDQRAPAEHRRQQQPSGLEDQAKLHQSAGQIAHPMQGKRADRKVEARLAKRNKLGIGGHLIPRAACQKFERRVGSNNPLDPWPAHERTRQRAALGAGIESRTKSPSDIFKAVDEPAGYFGMEEVDAAAPCSPVSMHSPSVTVEQDDRICGFHHLGGLESTYRDPSLK